MGGIADRRREEGGGQTNIGVPGESGAADTEEDQAVDGGKEKEREEEEEENVAAGGEGRISAEHVVQAVGGEAELWRS